MLAGVISTCRPLLQVAHVRCTWPLASLDHDFVSFSFTLLQFVADNCSGRRVVPTRTASYNYCAGKHEFSLAVLPHRGHFVESHVPIAAYLFNSPLHGTPASSTSLTNDETSGSNHDSALPSRRPRGICDSGTRAVLRGVRQGPQHLPGDHQAWGPRCSERPPHDRTATLRGLWRPCMRRTGPLISTAPLRVSIGQCLENRIHAQ